MCVQLKYKEVKYHISGKMFISNFTCGCYKGATEFGLVSNVAKLQTVTIF